jgi:hypothetical protein
MSMLLSGKKRIDDSNERGGVRRLITRPLLTKAFKLGLRRYGTASKPHRYWHGEARGRDREHIVWSKHRERKNVGV